MTMLRDIAQWTMYIGMGIAMGGGATWPRPTWTYVGLGLAVIAIGIVMKRSAGAPTEEAHVVSGGDKPQRSGTIEDALTSVAAQIEELAEKAPELDFEAIKKKVEDLNWLGPERLGQAQEAVAARIGFPAYAEMMGPLATAERLLNRAWSAAADGHRPETVASIAAAIPYAKEAAEHARARLGAKAS